MVSENDTIIGFSKRLEEGRTVYFCGFKNT